MAPHDVASAGRNSRPSHLCAVEDVDPQPIRAIGDADQCIEAIEDLALDIGYFADLVQASRRLAEIRNWIAREMARVENACPTAIFADQGKTIAAIR